MAKTEPRTEFERFKGLMGRILRVSKEDLVKREAEYKKSRQARKPKPAR